MKAFIAVCCVLSVAHGSLVAIIPSVSHYHSQDTLGQYSYGYHGGPSSKQEFRTIDGVTHGGYSYIDANNIIQTVSYISDPIHGFRVAATNLPQQAPHFVVPFVAPAAPLVPVAQEEPKSQVETARIEEQKDQSEELKAPEDTPEVIAARAAHFKAHEEAKAAAEETGSGESSENLRRRRRSAIFTPLAYYYSPVISTQYEVKDNLGQYSYGYNDGLSAKAESRSFDGTTSGGYSYLDSNGIVQNVNYIADSNGFRVAASNLPEAPKAIEAPVFVAPVAPQETPEVAEARAAHLEAHEKAKSQNQL